MRRTIDRFLVLIGAKQEDVTVPAAAESPVRAERRPAPPPQASARPAATPAARPTAEKPRAINGSGPAARPVQVPAAPVPARVPSPSPDQALARPAPSAATLRAEQKATNEEIVKRLVNTRWDILTSPKGRAPVTAPQSRYLALLSNPSKNETILVVASGFKFDTEVSSARTSLRRRGEQWDSEFEVELPVIRAIYEKGGHSQDETGGVTGTAQRGREFLDLVKMSADLKSSDLHLTVREHEATIEVRQDGELTVVGHMDTVKALEICQAAFAMADNSDPMYMPREAQEARVTGQSVRQASLRFPEGVQALRLQFAYLPPGGRYLVARLLYDQKQAVDADIDTLGYAKNHIRDLNLMRSRPYGVNIVSGPTGSGKSTTLQCLLTAIKRRDPGKNIISIEDPPEYLIVGVKQLAITNAHTEAERSAAYQKMMNNAMRQDPDIIMVGEVRDGPSAALMFKAAMSGHGVYTTVHANTAPAILDRLRDMGVEPYKLGDASMVTGLIGQKLLRVINPAYGVDIAQALKDGIVDPEDADFLHTLLGARARNVRFDGGYKLDNPKKARNGRSIIGETIHPDQEFLDRYFERSKSSAIEYWLDTLGGITMAEHGAVLVGQGRLCPLEYMKHIGRLQLVRADRVEHVGRLIG